MHSSAATKAMFVATAPLPTEWGAFTCHAFRDTAGNEHLALVRGDVADGEPVTVRLHSECLTGDVFGSRRCDCGPQLASAMQLIASLDRGVLVYLRGHEGRGIGLANKISAYELQDRGLDTVDANLHLGLPADSRDYSPAASILTHLGVASVRLITNNPEKEQGLLDLGLAIVERVALPMAVTPHNERYLRTKRERMGHRFQL
jgi:3,4-dihydroxy 2-butanone 4-phosphate synthase/GTP cyclohydrolase II